MFQNYFKVAFRNLIRNKLYSMISIIGLAIGYATCILIMLFVIDELSYDQHWNNADTIARVNTTVLIQGRSPFVSVSASSPLKEVITNFFPDEVIRATRFIPMHPTVTVNGTAFSEEMHWTDPETAKMFDLKVLSGDIESALNDKSSLVVSESFAKKYFGNEEAIGKILNIKLHDIDRDYKIGAVFKDLPYYTSLNFRAFAKFDINDFPTRKMFFDTWGNLGEHLVYIQLKDAGSFKSVADRLPGLVDKHVVGLDGLKPNPDAKNSDFYIQTLQKLTDIHLNPTGMGEMKPSGNLKTVQIFMVIAGIVLLIACINFMNLATAKSTQRAREVGLRKTLGASRQQLIVQFLGEAVILAIIGLLIGLIFVEISLPVFNDFLNIALVFSYSDYVTLLMLVGLVIIVGLIAGFYPAIILSGFLPARVLKSNNSAEKSSSANLRNILVVLQFTISISLIIATVTVYGQTYYATHQDMGYNKNNLIILKNANTGDMAEKTEVLKETLLKESAISSASYVWYSPIDIHERLGSFQVAQEDLSQSIFISGQGADYGFLDTFKIPLVAGRFYSRDFAADGMPAITAVQDGSSATGTIVINEASVKKLGLGTAEQAIGRYVTFNGMIKLEVIGVTPNIYFQSPKKPIRAESYALLPKGSDILAIKFNGSSTNIVNIVEKVWNNFTNTVPFQYEFVDEAIAIEFEKEQNLAVVLAIFSIITVLVACLGLYGLAVFTVEMRTKEIGIRKIMGASVFDIVRLLLWQFSKPVLIANLIAWPLSSWMMLSWLENFPTRLDSWLLIPLCLMSGLIALIIAWQTVAYNAARVARSSPVNALRYE